MGAPHSPLDPPKRPSYRPLSPVGGGTCAAAGDPVPEACSDLFLSVPWPQQVWAALGWALRLQRDGPFARGLQVPLWVEGPAWPLEIPSP